MIVITANLLEQCRRVVENENENENENEHEKKTLSDQILIFGGQGEEGIDAGSHKSSLTPKMAIRLFADAGFSEVRVMEHPCPTDMILEVRK